MPWQAIWRGHHGLLAIVAVWVLFLPIAVLSLHIHQPLFTLILAIVVIGGAVLYAGNKSETDATQAHGIEDVVMPVYYRCTASVLNVRSNPRASATVVGVLTEGDVVEVEDFLLRRRLRQDKIPRRHGLRGRAIISKRNDATADYARRCRAWARQPLSRSSMIVSAAAFGQRPPNDMEEPRHRRCGQLPPSRRGSWPHRAMWAFQRRRYPMHRRGLRVGVNGAGLP